jgi:hypothetical protein
VRFALLTTLFVHADSDGGVCSTGYSQTDSPDPPVHPAHHAAVSRRPTRSEHEHGQSLSPAQDANSDNIFLTFKRTVLWSPDFEAFRPDWWFEPALLDKVATMPPIVILRRSAQNQALLCATLPNTVLQPEVQQEDEDERENVSLDSTTPPPSGLQEHQER